MQMNMSIWTITSSKRTWIVVAVLMVCCIAACIVARPHNHLPDREADVVDALAPVAAPRNARSEEESGQRSLVDDRQEWQATQDGIFGKVSDASGAPVVGAMVRAYGVNLGTIAREEIARTMTAYDGRYVLTPIAQLCMVEASAPNLYTDCQQARPGSRVDFSLGSPGSLKVTVMHAQSLKPVKGCRIVLYPGESSDTALSTHLIYSSLNARGNLLRKPKTRLAVTSVDGCCVIESLRPGKYEVVPFPETGAPSYQQRQVIEISAGQEHKQSFAISEGFAVIGKVVDRNTKQPIKGASVSVMLGKPREVTTDTQGEYRIEGVDANLSHVFVSRAPGFAPSRRQISVYPHQINDALRLDFAMQAGGLVNGVVVTSDGLPVAGATVCLRRMGEDRNPLATLTKADGSFSLWGHLGETQLNAKKFGLQPARQTLHLNTSAVTNITLHLRRGVRVFGHVRDAGGLPVANALLRLRHPGGSGSTDATSNADGAYELRGIPPSQGRFYTLEVLPPTSRDAESASCCSATKRVRIPDCKEQQCDVTLRLGASISGTVVDENEQPIPGADIVVLPQYPRLSPPLDTLPLRYRPQHGKSATTDERGLFRVNGLDAADGPFAVTVSKQGFTTKLLGGPAHLKTAVNAPKRDLVVRMRRVKLLTGRVVFAVSGEPVREYSLTVDRKGDSALDSALRLEHRRRRRGLPEYFVDCDGEFRIWLAPGKYVVHVKSRDHSVAAETTVEVPAVGSCIPLEVRVKSAGVVLTCSVVSAPSVALRTGQLTIYDATGGTPKVVSSTRLRGGIWSATLPRGKYVCRATADDPMIGSVFKLVHLNQSKHVVLSLGPAIRVRLTVVTAKGEKIERARMQIARSDGLPNAMAETKAILQRELFLSNRKKQPGVRVDPFKLHKQSLLAFREITMTNRNGQSGVLYLLPGSYEVSVAAEGYKTFELPIVVKMGRSKSGSVQSIEVALPSRSLK